MNRGNWVTCCALIALSIVTTYANGQDDIFGPSPVVKQAEAAEKSVMKVAESEVANPSRDFCQCVGESESESVAKIEKTLRSPLTSGGLDFADTTLAEVVSSLQEQYNIPIKLDTRALDEMGLGPDEPVTISLHNVSLRSALNLMLRQLQLTYIIQDEVLMITSPAVAETEPVTCVYDVREIADSSKVELNKQLTDTIVSCIACDTWAVNGGGEAEIRPLTPGLLVISQTRAVQDDIRALLTTIRQMRERPQRKNVDAEKAATIVPEAN